MPETLKDANGHIIGKIFESNGKLVLKDRSGNHTYGTYDPKTNITKDAGNHRVGYGNLLAKLLP